MNGGYDAWRAREDERLGAQGVGPYAQDVCVQCVICAEMEKEEDAAVLAWCGVNHAVCHECASRAVRGDLS